MELASTLAKRKRSHRLLAAIRAEAPLHLFVLCYFLAGTAAAEVLGVPQKSPSLGGLTLLCLAIVVLTSPGADVVLGRTGAAGVERRGADVLSGLLLLCSWAFFMDTFVSVKAMLPDMVPFHADRVLMQLDRVLLGDDAWKVVLPLVPGWLMDEFELFYFLGWALLMVVSLIAAALSPSLRHLRGQYFWSHFVTWAILGNIVAAAFMSAGPILYDQVDGRHFASLNAYLSQVAPWTDFARSLGIRAIHGDTETGLPISAFPSLHVAQATLLVLLARGVGPKMFAASVGVLLLVLVGSVALGWHYAVDGIFSIAATLWLWRLVGRFTRAGPAAA